jgi:hypothetical protein
MLQALEFLSNLTRVGTKYNLLPGAHPSFINCFCATIRLHLVATELKVEGLASASIGPSSRMLPLAILLAAAHGVHAVSPRRRTLLSCATTCCLPLLCNITSLNLRPSYKSKCSETWRQNRLLLASTSHSYLSCSNSHYRRWK